MYETRKLLLHSKKRKRNQIENNITEDCDITNFAISGIINVHSFFFFSEIVNRYLRILHKKIGYHKLYCINSNHQALW